MESNTITTGGFCIYIDTPCEGAVPAVRYGQAKPCVFTTEAEAQREIADRMMTRLQKFIDGGREFDDAITFEEYIVPVDVLPDRSIVDEEGRYFAAGS